MSINRLCLFNYVGHQLFFFKQIFFVLYDSNHRPAFYRNIILFQPQVNRLLLQNYGLFFLRANKYFFSFKSINSKRNNLLYFFFIKIKKADVSIKPIFGSDVHFHAYIFNISYQSDLLEDNSQWAPILYTHPLAIEVIDYLGGRLSAF